MDKEKIGLSEGVIDHAAEVLFDLDYDKYVIDWEIIKHQFEQLFIRLQNNRSCDETMYDNYVNLIGSIRQDIQE